jgi:hypothetical protein
MIERCATETDFASGDKRENEIHEWEDLLGGEIAGRVEGGTDHVLSAD